MRFALQAPGDPRMERAVVGWQPSDKLSELGAYHCFTMFRIPLVADAGNSALAGVKLLLRDPVEPRKKRIRRWRLCQAYRHHEAKRSRESRHQSMIDRLELSWQRSAISRQTLAMTGGLGRGERACGRNSGI